MPLGNLAATHAGFAEATPVGVFFTGSTAIVRGQGLCYDRDYGTAADAEGRRGNYVEVPTTSNNMGFAGVAVRDYPAVTGGQPIQIYVPGSICPVSNIIATTVNATRLTCLAASTGVFSTHGFPGRGTALALQTKAVIAATTDLSAGVFFSSLDGTATYTTATKTVTKTNAFQYVPDGITSADGIYVHILAGATSGTGADQITPGKYLVASKTSASAVVLVDSAGAADVDINFCAVRGNPTVMALLMDGEESGLTEWVSPDSGGAAQFMVGGYSRIFGGIALAADSTATLANGTFIYDRKGISLVGALGSNNYVVTVTTGVVVDASQASMTLGYSADTLATLTFNQDGETAMLIWNGAAWALTGWTATAGLVT